MADENQNQTTPQGNEAEARTADGTLKDQNPTLTTPSGDQKPEPKPEAKSFLNREAEKPEAKPKPEGEKAPEGEKKPEAEVASGAPEKYADFKLPEGYAFDPEASKQITALFKDLNLTQEGAQKLVDYYANNSLQAAEAPYKLWADTQKEWVGEIDNRFGSKAEAMRTDINKAIDSAISSPKLRTAFREALDLTGAGSNPDFFEALSIFAKPFIESAPVRGNGPTKESQSAPAAPSRPSAAEAIYPHLIPNRGGT